MSKFISNFAHRKPINKQFKTLQNMKNKISINECRLTLKHSLYNGIDCAEPLRVYSSRFTIEGLRKKGDVNVYICISEHHPTEIYIGTENFVEDDFDMVNYCEVPVDELISWDRDEEYPSFNSEDKEDILFLDEVNSLVGRLIIAGDELFGNDMTLGEFQELNGDITSHYVLNNQVDDDRYVYVLVGDDGCEMYAEIFSNIETLINEVQNYKVSFSYRYLVCKWSDVKHMFT